MFHYKINFDFIDELVDREKAVHEMYWYLGALYKNGNALRDYKAVTTENGYDVYIGMHDRFSIEKLEYSNVYLNDFYDTLKTYFNISYEILGEIDEYEELCSCERPSSYIMYTTQYDPERLVVCGDCGGVVPLYKLPCLDPYKEEHLSLLSWQESYRAIDKICLHAANERLERSALYQLHNPKSPLSTWGRALCSELEEKTGLPTYYYLFSSSKGYKKCPLCGKPWREAKEGMFSFFCDECRLVTNK